LQSVFVYVGKKRNETNRKWFATNRNITKGKKLKEIVKKQVIFIKKQVSFVKKLGYPLKGN
jgi:hypothetical protein